MQTQPMKLPTYAEKRFAHYLREMERSDATVEKYLHDLRCFISFLNKATDHAPGSAKYKVPGTPLNDRHSLDEHSPSAKQLSYKRHTPNERNPVEERHSLCEHDLSDKQDLFCEQIAFTESENAYNDGVSDRHTESGANSGNASSRQCRLSQRMLPQRQRQNLVTKQDVLAYKSYLAENYAVTSANSMIAALNCFFRFCGRDDMCVKQYRVQRKIFCSEEKELSKAEYLRLLKAAKEQENEQIGLIVQTICGTGIRVSELKYITVEAAMNEEAVVRCKGKNRRVFIVTELKKKLLRYSKKHGIRSGTIFRTKNGKDISRNSVWKAMKKLCKKANVAPSKVFPHNLRHLFARTFYGIEKDIAKLSDILGHTSIDTTRIYIITTGAEHRRKMENMRLVL